MKNLCKSTANRLCRLAIIALVTLIGLSMAACGGGGGGPGPDPDPYVPTTTIYTSGYYHDGIDVACYWELSQRLGERSGTRWKEKRKR